MVSKKKRPLALEAEVVESAGKKARLSDGASTSFSIPPVANKSDRSNVGGSRSMKSKDTRDSIIKTEVEEEVIEEEDEEEEEVDEDDMSQTHHTNQSNVGELTHFVLCYIFKMTCTVGVWFFIMKNTLVLEICVKNKDLNYDACVFIFQNVPLL
jgi:hypothetical protein